MQEMNLQSIRNGTKKTYSKMDFDKNKDSLKKNFNVNSPNKVWVSDITTFKLGNKPFYICVIIDLFSRRVIAFKVSERQSTQLVTTTLKLAYNERIPKAGLIFHSDRGAQYASFTLQKLLNKLEIKRSYSPKARPHNNAVMKSFFSSLKKEELYRIKYHTKNEFKKSLKRYVEFYNSASSRYYGVQDTRQIRAYIPRNRQICTETTSIACLIIKHTKYA